MNTMADYFILLIGIALIVFFLLVLIVKFVAEVYVPFVVDRDYIKTEIMRTYGDSRRRWERELKRLYLRHIPLIGTYLVMRDMKKKK